MKRQKRDWVVLIEEQERSGESVKEFCKGKGIHPATFYKSRKSYGKKSMVEIPAPVAMEINPLILKTGRYSLAIEHGFDPESLKSVLQVLGEIE
jgi:hypothetical protein